MLNIVLWLIAGGIIGWVASVVLGRDAKQVLPVNVRVGMVPRGAVIGRNPDYEQHTEKT